jgi:hypothetical protein
MEGGEGGGVANVRNIYLISILDWSRSMHYDGGRSGHVETSQLRAELLQAKV